VTDGKGPIFDYGSSADSGVRMAAQIAHRDAFDALVRISPEVHAVGFGSNLQNYQNTFNAHDTTNITSSVGDQSRGYRDVALATLGSRGKQWAR